MNTTLTGQTTSAQTDAISLITTDEEDEFGLLQSSTCQVESSGTSERFLRNLSVSYKNIIAKLPRCLHRSSLFINIIDPIPYFIQSVMIMLPHL